jgi:hypothetical protein
VVSFRLKQVIVPTQRWDVRSGQSTTVVQPSKMQKRKHQVWFLHFKLHYFCSTSISAASEFLLFVILETQSHIPTFLYFDFADQLIGLGCQGHGNENRSNADDFDAEQKSFSRSLWLVMIFLLF